MRQSLDTHRLFVDETAERSFLDCMLIPSPSPIHVFTQEEMQTFICSRRKKNKAHEHKANSGVPFCPVPINRLVRASLPLWSRASKDSSRLHEQSVPYPHGPVKDTCSSCQAQRPAGASPAPPRFVVGQ